MDIPEPTQDVIDLVLRHANELPEEWSRLETRYQVRWLRFRLGMTQRQLALLSGLPHSTIARVELGRDITVRALSQLFAGLGCGLAVVPVCRLNADALRRRTWDLEDMAVIPRHRRGW